MIMSRFYDNVVGGVERMSIDLANNMIARGIETELFSWDRADGNTCFPLDPQVKWHKLDMGAVDQKSSWFLRAKRIHKIRQIVKQSAPDVIVGFQSGIFWNAVAGSLGMGIPVIAAERNAPDRFDHLSTKWQRPLIDFSFLLATRVTVQFKEYVDRYPGYLRSRIIVIGNPVPQAFRQVDPGDLDTEVNTLICVGRLCYQKNQGALLDAFDLIAGAFPNWRLKFLGVGEDTAVLRARASVSPFASRIEFTGSVLNVSDHLATSHLFCLPSRWEGFPNAMAEAMAHGLPCVGFQGCAGMPQLLHDGKTGGLAEGNGDPESLAKALSLMMRAPSLRKKVGDAARAFVSQFEPGKVYDEWEALFRELGGKK